MNVLFRPAWSSLRAVTRLILQMTPPRCAHLRRLPTPRSVGVSCHLPPKLLSLLPIFTPPGSFYSNCATNQRAFVAPATGRVGEP